MSTTKDKSQAELLAEVEAGRDSYLKGEEYPDYLVRKELIQRGVEIGYSAGQEARWISVEKGEEDACRKPK